MQHYTGNNEDIPRANIVDAIYKKYNRFFFKLTSRDSCSWSTLGVWFIVHSYSSSCCRVSFLIFPCSPLLPGQQDQCVCMFPLAPRPARPVCVYVRPCTLASKTSVCVCSPLHPGQQDQCVCVCSPLHPGQQDQCVCMFPLASRPARPVCVYVPPCTPASKASVCVCSPLHPGKQDQCVCMHVHCACMCSCMWTVQTILDGL